tara:strand:- start:2867 stop:3238 length:372 start_codon:yes stop_codon:yes gene_type:complete
MSEDYETEWFNEWKINEDLDKILTDRGLKKWSKSKWDKLDKKCCTKDYVEDAMLEADIFDPERWNVDSHKFVLKNEKVDTWDKVITELIEFQDLPELEPDPEPTVVDEEVVPDVVEEAPPAPQ